MGALLDGERLAPKVPDPELPAEFTPSPWGQIDRGPIDAMVDDDILAGIEREIRRLLGYERVFEPASADVRAARGHIVPAMSLRDLAYAVANMRLAMSTRPSSVPREVDDMPA